MDVRNWMEGIKWMGGRHYIEKMDERTAILQL